MLWFLLLISSMLPGSFAGRDSQGTEFILAFMENKIMGGTSGADPELWITTVSNTPASVTITTPKFNANWQKQVTVSRGNIVKVTVPLAVRCVGIEKTWKSVWIRSTQEVSVYAVNKEKYSTDAYVSLPLDVLGQEYYAMTYIRDAEIALIGTQDNTQVSIKWPSKAGPCSIPYGGKTYQNGQTMSLTLHKFEVLHIMQDHDSADFTGAYITSNKPIGALSGNKKIPVPVKAGSADHVTEMLMPVDTWGKEFLTTSTPDRSIGDMYRVVASESNTRITFGGGSGSYTIKNPGEFKELDISTGKYQTLVADKPVMVGMFAKTFKNDGPYKGDPAMSLIIPTPQFASDYTWATIQTPTGTDFNNKISVIIESSKKSGLVLDGKSVSWKESKSISGSTKVHLWARVSPGSHNIYHTDPSVTFLAFATGTEQYNSYAYAAGLRLAQINAVCVPTSVTAGDILDNDCDGRVDEEALNGIDDDGDGQVDEDLALPPRIDGNWGSWQSWGSCSVSCGGTGTATRIRNCDNPAPANNGLDCAGSGSETQSCNAGSCTVHGNWGAWSSWSSCTVTCGGGSKTHTRLCNNPAPAHGGNQCAGSSSESTSCGTSSCPIDGNWGSWSSWSSCTVTCGGGSKTHTRQCNNPAPAHGGRQCSGASSESTSCGTSSCPIDGNWGAWSSWTSCTVTCGGGSKTHTRQCNNPAPAHGGSQCGGSSTESTSCGTINCPIDGGWGSWTSWGTCSTTCGPGSWTRSRQCNNPTPQYNGAQCSGAGTESTSCNILTCPIDGNWGSWGSWDACSVTCGGGFKTHTRSCDNPAPAHGGASCAGSASETGSCNTQNCPIDGNWGSWTSWGSCSTTCALGTMTRSRACDSPPAQYGGAACPGTSSDSTSCNLRPCPIDGVWGAWTSWGTCSTTCELGTMTRSRNCDNPAPLYGGAACPGSSGDSTSCNLRPCPVDGNWAAWSSWGTCSTTCGPGTWSRSRTCTNPAPAHGGANCPSVSSETTSCNLRPCPIDGAWSTWQAWSACSVTCMGIGVRGRLRLCDNPTPMYGGAQCPGASSETETCNKALTLCSVGNGWAVQTYSTTPGTPINGGFGPWGSWSACSKSCGAGIQMRMRQCNNPVPQFGGDECSGDYVEKQMCNNIACPGGSGYIQTCPERYFDCKSGNITCVHYLRKCDCIKDCDDASDEDVEWAGCMVNYDQCTNRADTMTSFSVITLLLVCLATLIPWHLTWVYQ